MRHTLLRLVVVSAFLLSVVACGSKGPLTHPSDEPNKSAPPTQ